MSDLEEIMEEQRQIEEEYPTKVIDPEDDTRYMKTEEG